MAFAQQNLEKEYLADKKFFQDNFLAFAQLMSLEIFGFDDDSDFLRDMCQFYDGIWHEVSSGGQVLADISAPVQHGKTTKAIIWAAYVAGLTQGAIPVNYFCADDNLRRRAAREFAKLVNHPAYEWVFGKFFRAADINDGIFTLPDSQIGFRILGGGHTGFPSSVIIIDDPYKSRRDAFSKNKCREVRESFEADTFSRLTPAYAVVVLHSRWHKNDLISWIQKDPGRWNSRSFIRAAIKDGKALIPKWRSLAWLESQRLSLGNQMFAALYQQNPVESQESPFQVDIIPRLNPPPGCRYYITVDSANSRRDNADYTVMLVFAVDSAGKFYLVDGLRDRIAIDARSRELRKLAERWNPAWIGYEKYGLNTDIEYIQAERRMLNQPRLPIVELGGRASKHDRILRLVGLFNQGILNLPDCIEKVNSKGEPYNLVDCILDELLDFPTGEYDDAIDALSRIIDLHTAKPIAPRTAYEPESGKEIRARILADTGRKKW